MLAKTVGKWNNVCKIWARASIITNKFLLPGLFLMGYPRRRIHQGPQHIPLKRNTANNPLHIHVHCLF